jgi:hypothetical protein
MYGIKIKIEGSLPYINSPWECILSLGMILLFA